MNFHYIAQKLGLFFSVFVSSNISTSLNVLNP